MKTWKEVWKTKNTDEICQKSYQLIKAKNEEGFVEFINSSGGG